MKQIFIGTLEACAHEWKEPYCESEECSCEGVICMDCGAEWEKE